MKWLTVNSELPSGSMIPVRAHSVFNSGRDQSLIFLGGEISYPPLFGLTNLSLGLPKQWKSVSTAYWECLSPLVHSSHR